MGTVLGLVVEGETATERGKLTRETRSNSGEPVKIKKSRQLWKARKLENKGKQKAPRADQGASHSRESGSKRGRLQTKGRGTL